MLQGVSSIHNILDYGGVTLRNRGDLAFCVGPSMTMKLLAAEFRGALLILAGSKLLTHCFVCVQD
jgi:hypothetical protein